MKWDLDSHTSSRSLTHPAGNLNNKPAARNDHTAQPETEPALNRFTLKPLALRQELPWVRIDKEYLVRVHPGVLQQRRAQFRAMMPMNIDPAARP